LLQLAPDVPGTTSTAHILAINQAELLVFATLYEQQRSLALGYSREQGWRSAAEISVGIFQLLVRLWGVRVQQLRAIGAELEDAVSVVVASPISVVWSVAGRHEYLARSGVDHSPAASPNASLVGLALTFGE
jgi:hypothetical protein